MSPIHIHPTAELAPRALLPGDPGRALHLAQTLLAEPRMFNHNRGLWGYTGTAADGAPLTIQSTGMGGPSAAIVLAELIELGLERAIRVGTCGALDDRLELGQLLIADAALADDGASRALGAGERVPASATLTERLRAALDARVETIVSTDLFYAERDAAARWLADGAVAVEMEAATLFELGRRRGIEVGCVLAVSDRDGERLDADALIGAGERAGAAAAGALAV